MPGASVAKVRDVKARRVQVDKIWSFTYAKQKNDAAAKRQDRAYGDTWTWTAIEADSKLIISWLVGGRDGDYATGAYVELMGTGTATAEMLVHFVFRGGDDENMSLKLRTIAKLPVAQRRRSCLRLLKELKRRGAAALMQ